MPQTPPRHVGPPMLPLALVVVTLFLASLLVGVLGGGPLPSPYGAAGSISGFLAEHPTTVRGVSTLQLGCAVPLAVLGAALSSRVRFLGFAHVPGVLIASTGGVLGAGFLALGALVLWVISRPDVHGHATLARGLYDLAFAMGGPGHVVFLGLLVAGIAVPALVGRLLPRWLALGGVGLAVVAELATLTLLVEPAAYLLPVARFGGLAWLVAAAALLPATRPSRS